jgi:hypothetical protein
VIVAAVIAAPTHEARFNATVQELHDGTTCEVRRATVHKLHRMNDKRAIVELNKARYRMRGDQCRCPLSVMATVA